MGLNFQNLQSDGALRAKRRVFLFCHLHEPKSAVMFLALLKLGIQGKVETELKLSDFQKKS